MKTTEKKAQSITKSKSRINKNDLARLMSETLGIPKVKADQNLECLFDLIKQSLAKDQSVMIKSFGIFEIRKTKERVQFGSFSKKPKKIASHKRAKFKASPKLNKILS